MGTTQIKDGFQGGSDNQLKINADGSLNVSTSGGINTNVNLHDGSGNSISSTDGVLNVDIVTPGTAISQYNEITGVAMASTATILSYTVPVGKTLMLNSIQTSSDSVSTIEVDINGSPNAKGRMSYTNYNIAFGYNLFSVFSGEIVLITGTNNSQLGAASFNATLQGVLE